MTQTWEKVGNIRGTEGPIGPGSPFLVVSQSAWEALEVEVPGVLYIVMPD